LTKSKTNILLFVEDLNSSLLSKKTTFSKNSSILSFLNISTQIKATKKEIPPAQYSITMTY
jgi:hypothetical protein